MSKKSEGKKQENQQDLNLESYPKQFQKLYPKLLAQREEGKLDANDVKAQWEREKYPKGYTFEIKHRKEVERQRIRAEFPTATQLKAKHKNKLNPHVIKGLVRASESMNIVAPPKVGKTFFTYNLAFAIATGAKWMNEYECTQGKVLILDNELHENLASFRLDLIAEKMHIPNKYSDYIHIKCCRGTNTNINDLGDIIKRARFIDPKVVIIDAIYRFFPEKFVENDNADWTRLYNTIDAYMMLMPRAAFIIIHHTSKGTQGGKDITDVGGGGGAQSRAADTHSILRSHEQENCYAYEAECRSFKKSRIVVHNEWPIWTKIDLDPDNIKGPAKSTPKKRMEVKLTNEKFSKMLVVNEWLTKPQIIKNIYDAYGMEVKKDAELAYLDIVTYNNLDQLTVMDPPKKNEYFICEFYQRLLRFQKRD